MVVEAARLYEVSESSDLPTDGISGKALVEEGYLELKSGSNVTEDAKVRRAIDSDPEDENRYGNYVYVPSP